MTQKPGPKTNYGDVMSAQINIALPPSYAGLIAQQAQAAGIGTVEYCRRILLDEVLSRQLAAAKGAADAYTTPKP